MTPGAADQVEPGTGQLATSSALNPQQQEILRQQQAGEITGAEARLRFQELARFPSGGGGFVSSPASFTQQAMSSGGSIGPSGLLTTPRLENLIQGNAQGRPNSLLSFAGLRPLSAQAISRSSPSELGMFREIGRLAGIPDDDFEQEMRAGIPFSSNASQAHSPIRRRQQRRSFV